MFRKFLFLLIGVLPLKVEASSDFYAGATGAWNFSEGSGASTADLIGSADMYFLNLPTWGDHEITFSRNAANPTVGSFGRVPVLNSLTGPFSLAFSFRLNSFSGTSVIFKKADGNGHSLMALSKEQGSTYMIVVNGQAYFGGAAKINVGEWHDFKIIFNGRTLESWVDGKIDFTETITLPTLTEPIYPLTFAADDPELTSVGGFTNCSLREVAVFDQTLPISRTSRSPIAQALVARGTVLSHAGQGTIEVSPQKLKNGLWVTPYTIDGLVGSATIGWATSVDGFSWVKKGRILGAGAGGEPTYCARGFLLQLEDGTLELYYSNNGGNAGSIRRVISHDGGGNWSAPETVLDLAEAPSGVAGYTNLCITQNGAEWVMFVETWEALSGGGRSYQIRKATSSDRLHWNVGSSYFNALRYFAGGMASHPYVFKVGDKWHMFYHASSQWVVPSHIFHATSPDLDHWTVNPYPVITVSGEPAGAVTLMDQVADVTVREFDGVTYVFYDCDDNVNSIGEIRLKTFNGSLAELVSLDENIPNTPPTPPLIGKPPRPHLFIGNRPTIRRATVRIRGNVRGAVEAVAVELRGAGGRLRRIPVAPNGRFQAKLALKKGRNVFSVRTRSSGGVSAPVKVVIVRR